MKTLIPLLVALSTSAAFSAEEKKDDPIVGVWRGFGIEGRVLEFYSDGRIIELKLQQKGRQVAIWKQKPSSSAEQKYTITFGSGNFVYEMQMNRAADKLNGKSSSGKRIEATLVSQ
jgi:hypothetical protein